MAKYEKNFSWTMTVETQDGVVHKCNTANAGHGRKQSWYATEKAARKALAGQIEITTAYGNKVIAWAVVDRNGTIQQGGKTMDTRTKVVQLVETAIAAGDYNYIRQAMNLCTDESGVWMAEGEDFVMVDDDVYFFNGAF